MKKFIPLILLLLFTGCSLTDNMDPMVVSTYPKMGEEIDPTTPVISVTFNEPMRTDSYSWAYENKDSFPKIAGDPWWSEDKRKHHLPVFLKPNKKYVVWINSDEHKGFRDEAGNPAEPVRLEFYTSDE